MDIVKITKAMLKKLSDPNITIKEYNDILQLIENKTHEIWMIISRYANPDYINFGWKYSNANKEHDKKGKFDPVKYKDFIEISDFYSDDHLFFSLFNIDNGNKQGFKTSYLLKKDNISLINDLENAKNKLKIDRDLSLALDNKIKDFINNLAEEEIFLIKNKKYTGLYKFRGNYDLKSDILVINV